MFLEKKNNTRWTKNGITDVFLLTRFFSVYTFRIYLVIKIDGLIKRMGNSDIFHMDSFRNRRFSFPLCSPLNSNEATVTQKIENASNAQ